MDWPARTPEDVVQQEHLSFTGTFSLFYWERLQAVWSLTVKIYCSGVMESRHCWVCLLAAANTSSSPAPTTFICKWIQMNVPVRGSISSSFIIMRQAAFRFKSKTFSSRVLVWRQMRNKLLAAVTPFWLGPCSQFWLYIPPCCTPPLLNLLQRLSVNCLYALQNPVAALHGYKGSPHPPHLTPPTSQPYFSQHYAG